MVNNQRFFCRFVVYCPATMDVTLRNETWRGRVLDLSRALTAHEQVAAASWHPCLGALVDLASRVRDAVLTLDGMALLAPRRVTLIGLHREYFPFSGVAVRSAPSRRRWLKKRARSR